MKSIPFFLLFSFFFLQSAFAWAEEPLELTLDRYTQLAIDEGIRGRQNTLSFESAGYSREIAFRQTDSPNATLALSSTRNESNPSTDPTTGLSIPGWNRPTDASQGTLTVNQPLPTGTSLSAVSKYDDSNKPGITATLTQPLYLFVKNAVMRTRRRAWLSYESSKDSYESAVLSIRNQARGLYYDVMLKEEGIKVETRKVASSQALNEVTVALVQAGKLAPVEAMRSKIRLQTDQRQLRNAEVDRDKSILSAKNFIFISLDKPVKFLTRLEFKPFTLTLDRLLNYALLHRPELKNLRRARELAEIDFQASKEPTRPTLSLNASYGYSETASVARNWIGGASANWLFFDSGVTHDQVRIAEIGKRVADLNLAETERSTRLDVQSAYLDVKNAERQIVEFEAARNQAHRNVEVLRLRFQNGLDRLIDVFDAETEARNLDFEYLGLLITYNRTKDNLAQLIGGDLEKVP